MNAPVKFPADDELVAVEIDLILSALLEPKSRKRVLDYFYHGWITAEMAERILISFDEAEL